MPHINHRRGETRRSVNRHGNTDRCRCDYCHRGRSTKASAADLSFEEQMDEARQAAPVYHVCIDETYHFDNDLRIFAGRHVYGRYISAAESNRRDDMWWVGGSASWAYR